MDDTERPTLGTLGEFGLIAAVTAGMPQGVGVLLGPGDDAAVVRAPDGRVVVTTDLLVAGRHFRCDWSSGYDVGRKAAAQNLADVAAMGAVPTAIVVGLAAPPDLAVDWAAEFAAGLTDECALVGASVVGGDLVGSDVLTGVGDRPGRPGRAGALDPVRGQAGRRRGRLRPPGAPPPRAWRCCSPGWATTSAGRGSSPRTAGPARTTRPVRPRPTLGAPR